VIGSLYGREGLKESVNNQHGEGDQTVAGIRTNTDPYPEMRVFQTGDVVEIELRE